MPEPTITVLEEWERIGRLLTNPDNFENITDVDLKFIKLNYDPNNSEIDEIAKDINLNSHNNIMQYLKKMHPGLVRTESIEISFKIYTFTIVYIVIQKAIKTTSQAKMRRFCNTVKNKMNELRMQINRLTNPPQSIPVIEKLYNLFERCRIVIDEN